MIRAGGILLQGLAALSLVVIILSAFEMTNKKKNKYEKKKN